MWETDDELTAVILAFADGLDVPAVQLDRHSTSRCR